MWLNQERYMNVAHAKPTAHKWIGASAETGHRQGAHKLEQALFILTAMLLGAGAALQISLVGAMSRLRGPGEASWISILGSLTGLALVIGIRQAWGEQLRLPAPFDRAFVLALIAGGGAVALALAVRGIAPQYGLTGLLAVPTLIGAGFLVPRIGIGQFAATVIAGQLLGAMVVDHTGAFGAATHRVDATRVVGIVALLFGVVLIKGIRL
jgi:transporter family-2 protein